MWGLIMKDCADNIQRLERDPIRFDVIDLFDAIGRSRKYEIGNINDNKAFVELVSKSLADTNTPSMIYGRRTEAMFSYVAASLGKCLLIKKEDSGDVFAHDGSILLPDYRLVLENNRQLLVEVKNYRQKKPHAEYSLKSDYMAIDNHHKDYVSAYLGDLGRDLPAEEQNHWLQYNVVTSEKLSTVAFQRDFLCIATESNMSDLKFKAGFKRFLKKWRQRFSWDLFLPLSDSDEYNIKLLHIPITESQEEFDHQVLSLVKTKIDSLNEKEIVKQLKNSSDLKGGISKLERWLSEQGIPQFETHIKFLRNLQELRSTGTGHRKGKGYEKIKQEFGLSDSNFADVFDNILSNANAFISFLSENFLS